MLFHNKSYKFNSPIVQIDRIYLLNGGSGGSRGGAWGGARPLIFRPNWGPKVRKKRFLEIAPPLSQRLDDPPQTPPPPFPLI